MPRTRLLPCVEVKAVGSARASIVWMHGLGADGNDFKPIVAELHLEDLGIRYVFPNAPSIPVTLNMGAEMPAWYDISEIDLRRQHDEEGIRRSAEAIEALIAREKKRGIPADRIIVAGFSQGGAMALHVGLRHPEKLAGILALSTYLVCEQSIEEERSEANREVAIFQAHGTADPMVPWERGEAARDRLVELGHPVEWKDYPMQHQVCLAEIQDISSWLRARLQ